MTRIFVSQVIEKEQSILLDDRGSHHLATVLRAKVGDTVTLFNGVGGEWETRISQINKKGVICQSDKFIPENRESPLVVYLFQAISRGEKMDFTIQKAVELGVQKIFPLFSERCNVKFNAEKSQKRLRHWQSIIISACEQSGRNSLPDILPPQAFNNSIDKYLDCTRFILTPTGTQKISNLILNKTSILCIFVGPEGGFSDAEIKAATALGCQDIYLGPRILRTETAGLAALAALQCHFGDM